MRIWLDSTNFVGDRGTDTAPRLPIAMERVIAFHATGVRRTAFSQWR